MKQEYDRVALQKQIREKIQEVRTKHKIHAPEFPSGLTWLNTGPTPAPLPYFAAAGRSPLRSGHREAGQGRPLTLQELRGKIVLLDFWTYCCINCLHVIPDLKYLEDKYAGKPLVVIGVHSAKFTNEKDAANVRQAVRRYEVEHPVVVDSDFTVWQSYSVRAWPTLVMIDPDGYLLGIFSGEGNREIIENYIETTLDIFSAEGKLDDSPLPLQRDKMSTAESYLNYPGKIAAHQESRRLAVADSNHHRIVIMNPGGKVVDVIGSGMAGLDDADFETARFFHPQGLAWHGDDLIVCDTDNHSIRRVDFGSRSVATLAGTGEQSRSGQKGGAGSKTPLNSPWDIYIANNTGYIAMAGPHQIWTIDLKTNRVEPFAGSGHEARRDGDLGNAAFAQPSGITGTQDRLFIADSEISSIRQIDLRGEKVETLVGGDLFQFGDRDGAGDGARLQHPLGALYHDGKVFVADTYNHKIKIVDPASRECKTLLGTGKPGWADAESPQFFEPSGLAVLENDLYIADTNNHLIRIANLQTFEVRTLQIKPAARRATEHLASPSTPVIRLPEQVLAPAESGSLILHIELPPGQDFNPGAPLQILSRSINHGLIFPSSLITIDTPRAKQTLHFDLHPQITESALRVELLYYHCDKNLGICMVRQAVYEMSVRIAAGGATAIQIADRAS
jgi:thiol-disulfide isomerase/thioredoxin